MAKLFKSNEEETQVQEQEQPVNEQNNEKLRNYTLIELLHLSYLIRDSLEYCHVQINVTQENFEKRAAMSKQMLAEGKFVERWITNHPNEEIRKVYPQIVNYFHNIYDEENFVMFSNRKVEPEKAVDFIEETIKNYQFVEDVLKAFVKEYKKTSNPIDKSVEVCINASFDYYRVIADWLLFNEVIKNDSELKKAQKQSGNKPSYEVNYNLNLLRRLIAAYNFTKERYSGDKVDIKQMFESSMTAFKALDGTLFKEVNERTGKQMSAEEAQNLAKETIEGAARDCVGAIKLYEPIWRETYASLMKYMQENPIQAGTEVNA